MNKIISIISVEEKTVQKKTGRGTYKSLVVTYDSEGKPDRKELPDWATAPEVYTQLLGSSPSDTFVVEMEKNDRNYWQWVGISRYDGVPPQSSVSNSVGNAPIKSPTKPTYETPEERAQKQVYIVRQSTLSLALETIKAQGGKPTPEEVMACAKIYESHVFGDKVETILDVTDDIPF